MVPTPVFIFQLLTMLKVYQERYFFKCREIQSSKASYVKEDWDKVWSLCQKFKEDIL
jgi:hypothetical protein